jgi:hypothetical protein
VYPENRRNELGITPSEYNSLDVEINNDIIFYRNRTPNAKKYETLTFGDLGYNYHGLKTVFLGK